MHAKHENGLHYVCEVRPDALVKHRPNDRRVSRQRDGCFRNAKKKQKTLGPDVWRSTGCDSFGILEFFREMHFDEMRCSADKLLTSWITSPHWWFQSQVQAAAVVKANKVVTLCSVLCCVHVRRRDGMTGGGGGELKLMMLRMKKKS